MELLEVLKEIPDRCGKSLKKLAEEADVNYSSLYKALRGETSLRFSTIENFVENLKVEETVKLQLKERLIEAKKSEKLTLSSKRTKEREELINFLQHKGVEVELDNIHSAKIWVVVNGHEGKIPLFLYFEQEDRTAEEFITLTLYGMVEILEVQQSVILICTGETEPFQWLKKLPGLKVEAVHRYDIWETLKPMVPLGK